MEDELQTGLVISFVVAFVTAFILGKEEKVKVEQKEFINNLKNGREFKSPVIGEMVALSDVNDDVFSSKVMGKRKDLIFDCLLEG